MSGLCSALFVVSIYKCTQTDIARFVSIFISMFWDGSITIKINSDRLYQVWFIFWFSYMTLESGFFLHHEGKLSTDEEDE